MTSKNLNRFVNNKEGIEGHMWFHNKDYISKHVFLHESTIQSAGKTYGECTST